MQLPRISLQEELLKFFPQSRYSNFGSDIWQEYGFSELFDATEQSRYSVKSKFPVASAKGIHFF